MGTTFPSNPPPIRGPNRKSPKKPKKSRFKSRRSKGEDYVILGGMAGSRCRVSFTDSDGVLHGVDVDAESLYEAVAVAVASLREDDVSPSNPSPMTEFTVTVYKN